MGGNALKNCNTRRYHKCEYFLLVDDVTSKLRGMFSDLRRIQVIQAYRTKDSFGDMDVLVESNDITFDIRKKLLETFSSKEIVKNSSVWSFEYKEFQIDLILTPAESFDSSIAYFSYNDLGNLVGRVAHKMGLKYGHDGLWYTYRDGDHVLGDILLTRNTKDALQFMGYSYEKFCEGFATLQDIFDYVVSSPYYNYDIFDLDNRNHRARVRDAKRKTYTEFLKWAAERKGVHPQFNWNKDKSVYLPMIFETFPHTKGEYSKLRAKEFYRRAVAEQFNGNLVSAWTGLKDKELGAFMSFAKQYDYARLEFLCLIKSGVQEFVLERFNEYNSNGV